MIKEQGSFVRECPDYGGRSEYGRRDSTRGVAVGGLVTGIVGTVLGAAALWNRNGGGLTSLLGGGSGGNVPANVNINGVGGGSCHVSPSPFEVYSKTCGDVLALTKGFYDQRITSLNEATAAREVDVAEKFQLYKSQVDADFGLYVNNRDNIDKVSNRINDELFSLYKYTRDKDDETRKELCDLKAQIAVNAAVRPYQDKLLQNEIATAFANAINYTDRKTCRMISGQVVIPNTPVVTGFGGYCCCGSNTEAAAG